MCLLKFHLNTCSELSPVHPWPFPDEDSVAWSEDCCHTGSPGMIAPEVVISHNSDEIIDRLDYYVQHTAQAL